MANVTLSTYALIKLEEFNAFIGRNQQDDSDNRKKTLINQISVEVENYLDRQIVTRGSLVEYHSVPWSQFGRSDLWLLEWPVSAVASVYEHPGAGALPTADRYPASTLLTVNVDYELLAPTNSPAARSVLRRIGKAWATGPLAIKVTCTGGFATTATVPQPIKAVCLDACKRIWEASQGPSNAQSLSDGMGNVVSALPPVLAKAEMERLRNQGYRRVDYAQTGQRAA